MEIFILCAVLHYIKGLIFRSLTDSYIGHNYFLLINVWRKYDYMKKIWMHLKLHTLIKTFNILKKQYDKIWYCLKCRKTKESKKPKAVNLKNGRIMLYQTVRFAAVKSLHLLKSKKLVDY